MDSLTGDHTQATPVYPDIPEEPDYEPSAARLAEIARIDEEGLDWTSAQYAEHSIDMEMIDRFLTSYFESCATTPSGTTAAMAESMTYFQKIGLLEEISDLDHPNQLPHGLQGEICEFVSRVDKEGFRTADD